MKTIYLTLLIAMISLTANAQTLQIGTNLSAPFLDKHADYSLTAGFAGLITYDLGNMFGIEGSFTNVKFQEHNLPSVSLFSLEPGVYLKPLDYFISPVLGAGFGLSWYSRSALYDLAKKQKVTTLFKLQVGTEININQVVLRAMYYYRTATAEVESFRTHGLIVTAGWRF